MRQTFPSLQNYLLCSFTLAFFRESVNEKGVEKLHKICNEILCSRPRFYFACLVSNLVTIIWIIYGIRITGIARYAIPL